MLSSQTSYGALRKQVKYCRPAALQLVDRVSPGVRKQLKVEFPDLALIQVVHVQGENPSPRLVEAVPHAHMLLLDSGNPDATDGRQLGGTGRVHDWPRSARIIRDCPIPVWLAGGLTPENVEDAIRSTRPYGVDVCSGLRPHGALEPEVLARFISRAHATQDVRRDQ